MGHRQDIYNYLSLTFVSLVLTDLLQERLILSGESHDIVSFVISDFFRRKISQDSFIQLSPFVDPYKIKDSGRQRNLLEVNLLT